MVLNKQRNKHLVQKRIIIILSLYILVIGAVLLTRFSGGIPILYGEESYTHLNTIQSVEEGGISLSNISFVQMLILPLAKIIPLHLLFFISPILGLLSIILFLRLTRKAGFDNLISTYWGVLLILSPAFIFTFTTLSTYAFSMLFALLGLTALRTRKKYLQWLSVPFFMSAAATEVLFGVLIILLLTSFIALRKEGSDEIYHLKLLQNLKEKSTRFRATKITLIVSIIALGVSLFATGITFIAFKSSTHNIWRDIISDFGAKGGISIFVLILSITGLFFAYKRRQVLYASLVILIPAYFWNTHTIFFLTIPLTYAAALGLARITNRKWQLTDLKTITLFLLALGIVFSTLTFTERLAEYSPSAEMNNALIWLKENAPEDTSVLTLREDGQFTEFISGMKVFDHTQFTTDTIDPAQLDPTIHVPSSPIFTIAYTQVLFPIFDQENIEYVYITPKIKGILAEDQGIRFVLRNENFKMIYASEGHEIWEYSPIS